MRLSLRVRPIPTDEKAELEKRYRQTKDVRIRERVQMILLAAEQEMNVPEISRIVRQSEEVMPI